MNNVGDCFRLHARTRRGRFEERRFVTNVTRALFAHTKHGTATGRVFRAA